MTTVDDKSNVLTLGNYNITATWFSDPKDEKDSKSNMPHSWNNRKKYFSEALRLANCDVMGLQELSPEQALDLLEMFPDHKFYFFALAQTKDIEAGTICSTIEEVKEKFLGKNIGTALIGIMYNNSVTPKDTGMFWYNPEPFKKPTAIDRAETDKGFGNMNTPRGPGHIKFTHNSSGKDFYFFTSHAPISGESKARIECFKLENKIIKEMTNNYNCPFFSIGDRNIFPDDNYEESYKALVDNDGVYDWINKDNHSGFKTTWLGYLYEPEKYQNKILSDGSFEDERRLDIGISSLKSISSAHYHIIIRNGKVELLGKLEESDNKTRNFLSDHSLVVAEFYL